MSERIEEVPAEVLCVTFTGPPLLEAFERDLGLPFPVLADTRRELYGALGFARGSVARVWLDPRVWARYARLLARGRRPAKPGEDTLQLGGDAVVDAGLEVRWVYRSRGPEDRPAVDELIAAVGALRG